jgi:NAD(P)-dependent dehydrogenase (short-subunit alcohol dehydrogenase family)
MSQPYFSDFRDKVVVVTGATAGVGRAITQHFARKGAKLGLLARGADGLDATQQEVERLGGQALAVQTDVAEADQVETAAAQIEEELGEIDIWVNNAMTSVFGEFTEIEPEEYQRVTDVCYHGSVWGTRAALKRMVPRDRGRLIFVGSALAYRGIPLQSAYCGAKHAMQGMFDSIRAELLHNDSNVTVSMVQLPAVNTPQFRWVRSKLPNKAQPVPPIYQPEIMADAIAHAARTGRREIFVGYPAYQVIWGNKLAPWAGDWYLALTGYEGQQMEGEPKDEDAQDNLFEPVPGDQGAHGAFDDRATDRSLMLWATKNRGLLAAAGAGLAGLVGACLAASD